MLRKLRAFVTEFRNTIIYLRRRVKGKSWKGFPLRIPVARFSLPTLKKSKQQAKPPKPGNNFKFLKKYQKQALLILILILGASNIYLLQKARHESPQPQTDREAREILEKISDYMVLPNESPAIATVADESKLQGSFYARAQKGDKVIVFRQAQKAILYRPSDNKVIDFTSVHLTSMGLDPSSSTATQQQEQVAGAETSGPTVQPTSAQPLTIDIYHSPSQESFLQVVEKELSEKISFDYVIDERKMTDEKLNEIIIVDLSKTHPEAAGHIARVLGGRVADLPPSSIQSDSDILIVIDNKQTDAQGGN
jgi:hypothetical protein